MKLEVMRHGLMVIPETEQDVAFLEDTLGLWREGDSVPLVRKDMLDLSCWGIAEACRPGGDSGGVGDGE